MSLFCTILCFANWIWPKILSSAVLPNLYFWWTDCYVIPSCCLKSLHTRLSATHLLSPDGSRNLLANSTGNTNFTKFLHRSHDEKNHSRTKGLKVFFFDTDNGFNNEDISLFNRLPRPRSSMFACFFSCHRSVKEYLARKKVRRRF